MRRLQHRPYRASLCMAAAVFLALPGLGQTQTTTPAPAKTSTAPANDDSGATTVTIFAKKRAPVSVKSFSQMSASSPSSCTFMTGNSALEDITDNYLSDMGYDTGDQTQAAPSQLTDPNTGDPMTDPNARIRTNDRAVYGDVSQSTGNMGNTNPGNMSGGASGFNNVASTPGGCTTADNNFQAGRNFIARKDTTFRDAMAAYDAGDYPKALDLFQKSYNKLGYPESALTLAQMYMGGQGTAKDMTKAIFWLKKVAELPVPDFNHRLRFDPENPYEMDNRSRGCMALARIYMTGNGVAKNAKEAKHWFMAADDGGYIPATHNVGLILQSGYGGEKNIAKAATYFERAGKSGFAPSQYALGQLYYTGAEGVAQDKTKAGAWLLAAAKAGQPDALYAVGRMYDLGEGGAQVDLPKALAYYKEAAVKGQVDAQVTLATYLYTGEGGAPKDPITARKLFQVAAEQGEPEAMFNLGVMLFNGEGGAKDRAMAYVWFELAAASGLDKAAAAAAELGPKLTPEERAQAEAILNPKK